MILELLSLVFFDKAVHDFENVDCSQESVCCCFTLTNGGNGPVSIEDIRVSCPCLSVSWDKTDVPSGSSSQISVTYHIEPDISSFEKHLYVKLSTETESRKLTVRGILVESEASLRSRFAETVCSGKIGFIPSDLDFNRIHQGSSNTVTLRLANLTSEYVYSDFSSSAKISAVPSSIAIPPLSSSAVKVTYVPDSEDYGMASVCLPIKLKNGPSDSFRFSALVIDDFSKLNSGEINAGPYPRFDSSTFDFKMPVDAATYSASIDFKNLSDSTLHIRAVYSDNVAIKPEALGTVSPGAVGSIELKINASHHTEVSGYIYMVSDSPLKPVSQIRIVAVRDRSYYDPSHRL